MRIVIYSPESAQCPQYPEKAQTHGNHSTDDLLKKKMNDTDEVLDKLNSQQK